VTKKLPAGEKKTVSMHDQISDHSFGAMLLAGIDEVGRGCLAGPVVAAAVILDPHKAVRGLMDSKKLTAKRRQELAAMIRLQARAWAIGRAEPSEIDAINILQASLLAMTRAYAMLPIKPDRVLVDGNRYPGIDCPGEAVVRGDVRVPEISAASILAKVARDEEMQTLDVLYPGYEFATHKGYATKLHQSRLHSLGVSELHRQSFAPVKKLLSRATSS